MSCSRSNKQINRESGGNDAAGDASESRPPLYARFSNWRHRRGCAPCQQAWEADRRAAKGLADMRGQPLPDADLTRLLEALGLPPLPALSPEYRAQLKAQLRRLLLLIGVILFVTTLAQPELLGRAGLEKQWFGAAHPNALQTAGLWLLMGLFWYLKTLFALLAQRVPNPSRLLRVCVPVSALLAACLWLPLGAARSPLRIAVLGVGISAFLALAGTLMGGVLVAQGQQMGATGRLGALHAAAIFLARLSGAGIVGALGAGRLSVIAPVCAVMLSGFALLCWLLMQDGKMLSAFRKASGPGRRNDALLTAHPQTAQVQTGAKEKAQPTALESLRGLLQSKNVLATAGIAFLLYAAPNFTSLQVQENARLGFSAAGQNSLDFVGGVCGLVGVGGYLYLCRRLSLQSLLNAGIACNALGTLLYLGYASLPTALLIEGANGVLSALVFAMLFDLAIRAIPRGQAMLGYAFLTGVFVLASHLSNVFGSWLHVGAGWNFTQVVGLSAALSLPALAVVARLPAVLLDRREGKIVHEAASGAIAPTPTPSYGHGA